MPLSLRGDNGFMPLFVRSEYGNFLTCWASFHNVKPSSWVWVFFSTNRRVCYCAMWWFSHNDLLEKCQRIEIGTCDIYKELLKAFVVPSFYSYWAGGIHPYYHVLHSTSTKRCQGTILIISKMTISAGIFHCTYTLELPLIWQSFF